MSLLETRSLVHVVGSFYIFQLFTLAGIYTGCACVAVAIVLIFLQQLPSERHKNKCSGCVCSREVLKPTIIAATFIHLKDYRQLLLIPLTMYSGLEQAFLAGDITQVIKYTTASNHITTFVKAQRNLEVIFSCASGRQLID